MPLTEEAITTFKKELVAIVKDEETTILFTHYDFLAVNQAEQLRRLGELVPEGSTQRAAAHALVKMKTEEEHQRVLRRTLVRLLDSGEPVVTTPADLDGAGYCGVVALFPLRT